METTQARQAAGWSGAAAQAVPALDTKAGLTALAEEFSSDEALQAGARLKLALGSEKRLVAVGGIKEDDGSSLLAASLGVALASLDENTVLLIDADSRGRRLSSLFGLPDGPGLLNSLEADDPGVNHAVRLASPVNLHFLALGRSSRSLGSLLGTPHCARLISSIRQRYRYTIVDCGTVCDLPDSMLLASLSDGVVAAMAAAARRQGEVAGFQQSLQRLNIPLLGAVLTKGAANR